MQYYLSQWHAIELDVGFLQTRMGDSVADMRWCALVKPGAAVERVAYQLMAGIRAIKNKVIPKEFNLATLALVDNRPMIAEK